MFAIILPSRTHFTSGSGDPVIRHSIVLFIPAGTTKYLGEILAEGLHAKSSAASSAQVLSESLSGS